MYYCIIGLCYLCGYGTVLDKTHAFNFFKIFVGYCYQMGFGTEKDDEKTVEWCQKSVQEDNSMAMCNLAT
ncbi:hypothetical protein RhiirB3_400986 [Rhizophagus irregularis]|nr:hypothetical protein RhiirB3_400986 [Rhizophagus irregularis]